MEIYTFASVACVQSLPHLLTSFHSIRKEYPQSVLYVLCIDSITYTTLEAMEYDDVYMIALDEIEERIPVMATLHQKVSWYKYLVTLPVFLLSYIMRNNPCVTYIAYINTYTYWYLLPPRYLGMLHIISSKQKQYNKECDADNMDSTQVYGIIQYMALENTTQSHIFIQECIQKLILSAEDESIPYTENILTDAIQQSVQCVHMPLCKNGVLLYSYSGGIIYSLSGVQKYKNTYSTSLCRAENSSSTPNMLSTYRTKAKHSIIVCDDEISYGVYTKYCIWYGSIVYSMPCSITASVYSQYRIARYMGEYYKELQRMRYKCHLFALSNKENKNTPTYYSYLEGDRCSTEEENKAGYSSSKARVNTHMEKSMLWSKEWNRKWHRNVQTTEWAKKILLKKRTNRVRHLETPFSREKMDLVERIKSIFKGLYIYSAYRRKSGISL